MNDTNTAGNGMTINDDLERQTLNSGGNDAQTCITDRKQTHAVGALAICQQCDGTGWTHHATKGLTKCNGIGLPHGH